LPLYIPSSGSQFHHLGTPTSSASFAAGYEQALKNSRRLDPKDTPGDLEENAIAHLRLRFARLDREIEAGAFRTE